MSSCCQNKESKRFDQTHKMDSKYTCPMHPEVIREYPGSCPACGMALEPMTPTANEDKSEYFDMHKRFSWSLLFTLPLFVIAMVGMFNNSPLENLLAAQGWRWIEFFLATPVVLWGAKPFFERGYQSVSNKAQYVHPHIIRRWGRLYILCCCRPISPPLPCFPPKPLRPCSCVL